MKLAYFSPLNPQPSGISDYSEDLLPYLAATAEIDLFVDGFQPSNPELINTFRWFDYRKDPASLERLNEYDAVVYHMGNDHRYHAGILEVMRSHPGIVVFHDFALQDFFLGLAREHGDMSIYLDEIAACYGADVRIETEQALARRAIPTVLARPTDFPLNCRVARAAKGLIVHSEWGRARFEQAVPGVPVAHVQMPVKPPGLLLRGQRAWTSVNPLRRRINLASFGLITPGKGIEKALRALSVLRRDYELHYTLVGAENVHFNVRELINAYGMADHVTITGQVSLAKFERCIAATDIAINLRERTVGETSASLSRIMSAGVPAVVFDVGSFAEVPHDCIMRIPLDDQADVRLEACLRELILDADRRRRIGVKARRHMLANHDITQSASRYFSLIHKVIAQRNGVAPQKGSRSSAKTARPAEVSGLSGTASAGNGSDKPARARDASARRETSRRMRLAYFSPLNPQPSGISDYSEELLPHLAQAADVDLYVDGFRPNNPKVTTHFRSFDYRRDPSLLARLSHYDAIVYHVGNDHRYHSGIVDTLRRHPGIVVFHDFALQDFFVGLARERGDMNIYFDEVEACHGKPERARAEEFIQRGSLPLGADRPNAFPLNCRLARAAEGIIVHSEWSRQRFRQIAPATPVWRVNHHVTAGAAGSPKFQQTPRKDGILRVASFGLITPDKGIERALGALAALGSEFNFHYTLVGSSKHFPELHELVRRYGLADRVSLTGYVSLAEFERHIAETDIAINLRERPVGATSGSLCRIMAAGVAAIVSDVDAVAELPDATVVKIDTGEYSGALLVAYLRRLLGDAALRKRLGDNARKYVLAEHNIEKSAERYLALISEVISRRPRKLLLNSIADELSLLAMGADHEALLSKVASEVAVLAPLTLGAQTSCLQPVTKERADRMSALPATESLARPATDALGRLPKIEGVDYKRAALEYPSMLDAERRYYLRTKPFYNLAHKPAKHSGYGMDPETHRHFSDFANMAVALALPAGAKILDVGCGSGWLSEYFARLGYEVTGIDISDDLIRMARERVENVPYNLDHETSLRCRFQTHDIEVGPLPEKFDAVICYDSLHHLVDECAVFRHLAVMLNVGGLFFILEGHKPSAGSATETELRDVMQRYGTLESPFSSDYLGQLIAANGFAVVGDYVSVNGLFEREMLEGDSSDRMLPLRTLATDYHYLTCMKVTEGAAATSMPDSREPRVLRAEFSLKGSLPQRVEGGEALELAITVRNSGDTLWLNGQTVRAGVVMPGVKIIDARGDVIAELHGHPMLPHAVPPGQCVEFDVQLFAPGEPGKYTVKIDLVDQHVCWFEERGSQPLVLSFEVKG